MKKVFLLVSVVVGLLICVSANVEAAPVSPGGITMYSGPWNFDGTGLGTGTLEGWALCNGSNGTPNLTDRFVCATTLEAQLGGTGGTTSHTHGMEKREVMSGPDSGDESDGDATVGRRVTAISNRIDIARDSNGTDYINSDGTGTATTVYNYLQTAYGSVTDSANTSPSYYKLAFIMKL